MKFFLFTLIFMSLNFTSKCQEVYRQELLNTYKLPKSNKKDSLLLYYYFTLSKHRNSEINWNDSLRLFSLKYKTRIGQLLWELKKVESAITNLKYDEGLNKILIIAKKLEYLNYKSYAAFAYLRAGAIYSNSSDNLLNRDDALSYYNKALFLAKSANDNTEIIRALDYFGELYYEKKEYDLALKYFIDAEKLISTNEDKYLYPTILCSLSTTFFQKDEIEKSNFYYKKMKHWLYNSNLKLDENYHIYIRYIYNFGISSKHFSNNKNLLAIKYSQESLNEINKALEKRKKRIGKFENFKLKLLNILVNANSKIGNYESALNFSIELNQIMNLHQKSELNNAFQELNTKYQIDQNKLTIASLENEKLKAENERETQLRWLLIGLSFLGIFSTIYIFRTNKKLKENNKVLFEKNTAITQAHLAGQTTERQRVAIDLHDNLGSTISSIKYSLEAIDRSKMNADEVAVQENLYSLLDKAYNDVRLLSNNLLPEEFEKQGLAETLKSVVKKINKSSKIVFDLKIDENFGRINKKIEFELYSICLELITNIQKHSKATEAKISLLNTGKQIALTVSDNGIGVFKNESDGKGMKNVQARVDSINGKWIVKSIEGEGVVNEIVV